MTNTQATLTAHAHIDRVDAMDVWPLEVVDATGEKLDDIAVDVADEWNDTDIDESLAALGYRRVGPWDHDGPTAAPTAPVVQV